MANELSTEYWVLCEAARKFGEHAKALEIKQVLRPYAHGGTVFEASYPRELWVTTDIEKAREAAHAAGVELAGHAKVEGWTWVRPLTVDGPRDVVARSLAQNVSLRASVIRSVLEVCGGH